jgi:type IV pilus assembly protein PilO
MKLGLREMIFLGAMLTLLGSAYFFFFNKVNQRRSALQADIALKQKTLDEVQRSTAGIDDLKGKIVELQKAIAFFNSKLPREKEIDQILKQTWRMAESDSLATKSIKTLKSRKAAGYSEQPIEIDLSGDFNGFYSFLLQLEKLPRITRVTDMHLSKINGQDGQMRARMTMSIFFEPDGSDGRVAAAR